MLLERALTRGRALAKNPVSHDEKWWCVSHGVPRALRATPRRDGQAGKNRDAIGRKRTRACSPSAMTGLLVGHLTFEKEDFPSSLRGVV